MASRKKPPGFEMPASSRRKPPAAPLSDPDVIPASAGHEAEATPSLASPARAGEPEQAAETQPSVGWVYRSEQPQGAAPSTTSPSEPGAAPAVAPKAAPTHWLERAVMQTLGSSYLLLLMPLSWKPLKRSSKIHPKE